MMGRRRAANGDECDAFSRRSRRLIAAFSRAGVASKTKRRARRRERHEARHAIRRGVDQ